jgi:NAD(P)-dependent dehydrogenase (short-subunit alcohol dehydrogenase family)
MSNDLRSDSSPDPAPVAVVTGASQGLGQALTAALVNRGWHVVVDARRSERLDEAVTAFGPDRVTAVVGDVTDPDHRDALVAAAHGQPGPVRLLVNNASTLGASPLPALDAVSPAVLERTFAVNVVAPVALTAALLRELAPPAIVVNITSDAAVEAYEGWGAYGSTKAALEHASRVLAVEHPELRVLAVDPGDLRTEMHQDAFPGEDISDRPPPESAVPGLLALIEGDQPSGRYAASAVAVTP